MKDRLKTGFADPLQTAADAKRALLDKLRPKPTQVDPQHAQRADMPAAELGAVKDAHRRQARQSAGGCGRRG